MRHRDDRDHVAWDIETTGLAAEATVTVAGFWYPDGHATLLVNGGAHDADARGLSASLTEAAGADVEVAVADGEPALLGRMADHVFERFDRNRNRLVAYNADKWDGGFDLPFVRTRCVKHGCRWPFTGVRFADLFDPVSKRLNTTRSVTGATAEVAGLPGAHALLLGSDSDPGVLEVDGDHPWYRTRSYDPFGDSAFAAERYRAGDLDPVCRHNLADVHRTWELGALVSEMVPAADVTTKKL